MSLSNQLLPELEVNSAQVPYFEQYLGAWAMQEEALLAQHSYFSQFDLHVHLGLKQEIVRQTASEAKLSVTPEGIAVISLRGTLMKQVSSYSSGTSTVQLRRQVREAARNPDVKGILLQIESPGGTVSGTKELADDVAAAALQKPVYAFIEDLGASAAYWVASQAHKIFANEPAWVGSIGTYAVVTDSSQMADKAGIKVIVVNAGKNKGDFTPGTKITEEQLANYQGLISGVNELFITAVGTGRKMAAAKVQALADGRVHLASVAQDQGLIDGVQSLEQTLSQLTAVALKRSPKMSPENTLSAVAETLKPMQAGPATYKELKAALPDADATFLASQQELDATVAQAQSNYTKHLSAELAKSKQELATAKEQASKATTKLPGVSPVVSDGKALPATGSIDDPVSQWNDLVASFEAKGMKSAAAISAAVQRDPNLHKAYLETYNSLHNTTA